MIISCHPRAIGVARRILHNEADANDAVMEAYAYMGTHPGVPETLEKYERILLVTTKQRALDILRKRRQDGPSSQDTPDGGVPSDILTGLIGDEQDQAVQQAIAQLPPRERQVIVLRYYADLGFAEIASCTGDTVPAVYMRHHRAKQRLKQILSRNDPGRDDASSSEAEPS